MSTVSSTLSPIAKDETMPSSPVAEDETMPRSPIPNIVSHVPSSRVFFFSTCPHKRGGGGIQTSDHHFIKYDPSHHPELNSIILEKICWELKCQ
jgi:hypothetical protein